MRIPSKCPICGGELTLKEVEEIVKGGKNTAILKVKAGICQKCGGRLYSPATIRKFEQIREKLEKNQVGSFTPLGKTFAAGSR